MQEAAARPLFEGAQQLGGQEVGVLTVSAASRSAAHSTLGIIRATKSGLNSTGLMRTSVACGRRGLVRQGPEPGSRILPRSGARNHAGAGTWRRRGKPRGPTPRTCELSKLWVSSFMSPQRSPAKPEPEGDQYPAASLPGPLHFLSYWRVGRSGSGELAGTTARRGRGI